MSTAASLFTMDGADDGAVGGYVYSHGRASADLRYHVWSSNGALQPHERVPCKLDEGGGNSNVDRPVPP